MIEQSGPPSKPVQATKQVQELVKDGDDAVIVGVFADDQDPAYEIYIEACQYLVSFYIHGIFILTLGSIFMIAFCMLIRAKSTLQLSAHLQKYNIQDAKDLFEPCCKTSVMTLSL